MTVILIILGFIFLFYLFSSKSSNNPKPVPKGKIIDENKTTDYRENDGTCYNCGGLGREYFCENCFSKPTHTGFSEHYDGDVYCSDCMKEGKEFDKIAEDYCSVCGGSGKHYDEDY